MAKNKKPEEEYNGVALDFTEFESILLRELKRMQSSDNYRPKKYDIEQIRRFLANPETNERQLREVSQYLLSTSSQYFRLIRYFSDMLTLDHMIIPVGNIDESLIKSSTFKNNFVKASSFVENYNIKHELQKIINVLMLEDVFFGYERWVGDSFTIQRLPSYYCKICSIEDGVFNFAFNFEYFNNSNKNIENYPPEFKTLFNEYQKSGEKWQVLDGDKSVCFKFRQDLLFSMPPFSGAFEDVLDMEDLKDLKKNKLEAENFKMVHQKIPMKKDAQNEKDFVLTLPSVKVFHNNIKAILPKNVGIVSTPMDLDTLSFEQRQDTVKQNTEFMESEVFKSTGVNNGLFGSDNKNTIAMNRAINADESMMFNLLRQFERFFKKRLKQFGNKKFQFKLLFPDITIYNRKEMNEIYLKNAQFGFPKSLVACTLGFSLSELTNLSLLENVHLNITEDMLIPLSSSHVGGATDDGGRPQKDDEDLSEEGQRTRDEGTNDTRAK